MIWTSEIFEDQSPSRQFYIKNTEGSSNLSNVSWCNKFSSIQDVPVLFFDIPQDLLLKVHGLTFSQQAVDSTHPELGVILPQMFDKVVINLPSIHTANFVQEATRLFLSASAANKISESLSSVDSSPSNFKPTTDVSSSADNSIN